MPKPLASSFITRALLASCLSVLAACGANKSTGDVIADAAPHVQPDAMATSPVADASLVKDAPATKDTAPSTTPAPDTAQPRSDLAMPDASGGPKDAGYEASHTPADALATVDTAPPSVDGASRGDAQPRADTQAPDSQGMGPDGAAACNPNGGPATLVHLKAQELKAILDSAEDPYLINVKGTSIPNIPGTDAVLASNVPGIEALVGKDLCADIILYCMSGSTSQSVGTQLIGKGYQRVRDLAGGITTWTAAGFPTQ